MARSSRSTRILALGAGAFATVLAACSLLNGLDADYRLQSAVSGEGGNDGADGNIVDGKSDTNVPIDGGPDGPNIARFCEAKGDAGDVTFCCDWEPGTECKWDTDEESNGTLERSAEDAGRNHSRGLRATVSKPAPSGRVFIRRTIPEKSFNDYAVHTLRFAFSVQQKSSLYTATLGALGFSFTPNAKLTGVSVYGESSTDKIDVSDPPGTLGGSMETVKDGEWRVAEVKMVRQSPGSYKATISVSASTTDDTLRLVDERTFLGGAAATEVLVGAFFTSSEPDGGVVTAIDDVLLTQSK
jgi:hypothetical protein